MTAPPALLGTYAPPAVRVGSRVQCLYRGAACKVTSFTGAPSPWPRVLPAGGMGRPGVLVNAAMRRAIKTESAEALKHWFGLSTLMAWKLRVWAGVEGHSVTPGSRRLQREVSEQCAAGTGRAGLAGRGAGRSVTPPRPPSAARPGRPPATAGRSGR